MTKGDFTDLRVYRMVSPERIESGKGAIARLPKLAQRLGGKRVIIATSNSLVTNTPYISRLQELLTKFSTTVFSKCRQHSPEADIDSLCEMIADQSSDLIVSIGGSSVFDTVKVATSRTAALTMSEPIPQIAIPTTLSAGEFTPGAGYTETATQSKKLVLDPRVAPSCVILDPELTLHTPEQLWFATGIKALDHAIEAIWSHRPHPYVDALALEAIKLLFKHLPLSRGGDNLDARAACQFGAWMSISGVGASGMRLSHFLGHQIGARMHIPHGVTSCILLPAVMRHLRDSTLDAQCRIAIAFGIDMTGQSREATADIAADRLQNLIHELGLPTSIADAGGSLADIEAVSKSSFAAAQQLGLEADLPEGEQSVREILMKAWA